MGSMMKTISFVAVLFCLFASATAFYCQNDSECRDGQCCASSGPWFRMCKNVGKREGDFCNPSNYSQCDCGPGFYCHYKWKPSSHKRIGRCKQDETEGSGDLIGDENESLESSYVIIN